jgi:hypothetical protein
VRLGLSFRDAKLCFRDIFHAIEMIEHFTGRDEPRGFRTDPKTIAAVERKLQVINEAAIRNGTSGQGYLQKEASTAFRSIVLFPSLGVELAVGDAARLRMAIQLQDTVQGETVQSQAFERIRRIWTAVIGGSRRSEEFA